MFYQTPDPDRTFLVVIAIIAGIVIVFMAVAGFVLLRSENKKEKPAPPDDEPQPIPPVQIAVASLPEEIAEEVLPSTSLVEILPASLPAEAPEHDIPSITPFEIISSPEERTENELPATPPVETVAASPPKEGDKHAITSIAIAEPVTATPTEERPAPRVEFRAITKEVIWDTLLTSLLMSASVLGFFYVYERALMLPGFWDAFGFVSLSLLSIGAALGGFAGIRILHVTWRQVIGAALLAEALLMIFARLRPSLAFPGDPFTLFFVPGGVFLLPLFDPAVRKDGPAPASWIVAPVAFVLGLLVIRSTLFHSPFGMLISPLVVLGILLGVLLSLSKGRNVADGAWVGGLFALLTLFLTAMLLINFYFLNT
jgi:hypothetical protein